jgi:transposase
MLHRHYNGKKVMIVMDRLPAHVAARKYFEREHGDWFEFADLPSYSPDLNPVEQCWNYMKNVLMANYVPLSIAHLDAKALDAAKVINDDPNLIKKFCKHAYLKL